MKQLVEGIVKGDKRSVAKAISIIENEDINKNELLDLLYRFSGNAKIIGITGPPGVGKSTLVDSLIKLIRHKKYKVGVIAVDPSSPFSGGAILGDRVRMQRHATDKDVYIRSMGNRGHLGGLAKSTMEATLVFDCMGMDYIIIETVGIGQSELDIIKVADTNIVVLNPYSGDNIQAIKAGIMEIADIFIVNKSDLPGSDKTSNQLKSLINMNKNSWIQPIIKTVANENQGIEQLWDNIIWHHEYLKESGRISVKKENNLEKLLINILNDKFQKNIIEYMESDEYHKYKKIMLNKEKSPIQISDIIYKNIK